MAIRFDENWWSPPLRTKRCSFLCEKVGVPDYVVNNAGAWAFQDFCDKYEENFLSYTYDIWTDVQSYTRFFQSIQRMPSCSFCYILVGLPLDKEKIQNYPKIGQWNGTPCILFILFFSATMRAGTGWSMSTSEDTSTLSVGYTSMDTSSTIKFSQKFYPPNCWIEE